MKPHPVKSCHCLKHSSIIVKSTEHIISEHTEQTMEMEAIYENTQDKVGPQTPSQNPTEAQNSRRWFVVITVGLGLICVLLVIALILLYIHQTAERDQLKKKVKEYNKTLTSLKINFSHLTDERDELQINLKSMSERKSELETNFSHLTDERDELQINLKSMSETKSELETNFSHLTDERDELQINLTSMSETKSELETRVKNLNDALMKSISGSFRYFISSEEKSWTDSRRFCRSRGGDLVIINTEEEQKYISSLVNENVWIGLSDAEKERNMKWVDNTPVNKGFWDKGEPNDYSGNENCVEIIHTKPILSNWNDFACSVMKKWICEK
ncbi:C-type lectin domain family 10 member A-like [Triplophysa rosa]|uniref:CD209 antigen n=1 Tax=Triplophysa rosa TaxID=992332 RepID=A0A9W7WZC1_TRIRA|nr:C-type lectin domain family 10 member A-like [Triplophysa rosa]KAI7811267.1 putative CD209 antigen [Triplophysa rosa]